MSHHSSTNDRAKLPRRVMLLLTTRSYRAQPFIDAAECLGIEVVQAIAMDRQLADYWDFPLGLDYSNPETCVKVIIDYAAKKPLGSILSVDDSGTVVAAQASQALGLPHNAPISAEASRNKFRMRQLLKEANVQSPQASLHHFIHPLDEHQLINIAGKTKFPCVLKPLTLNGSRGVIRANNIDEFLVAAKRLWRLLEKNDPGTTPKPFLVETYIPGIEVALEGILEGGQLRILALFDKPDQLEGPYFEETIYVTPSRLPESTQSAVFKCAARAAAAIGLSEGPIHAELRINEAGPWIVEIAGRSIGGLCSRTLRFGIDTSLEEMILRQSFGMEISTLVRENVASGVMMIPIPEAGLLKEIKGCEAAKAVPLVEGLEITARLNNLLVPLPDGDSYFGFIFARGGSPAAVEAALREAHSKLQFTIAPELTVLSIL